MQMTVTVKPTGRMIGAEVRCGDVRSLSDDASRAVYRALLDHLVILIRGQSLTDPELIAFGRRFGELDFAPLARTGKEKARPHPEIIVVSNVLENGVPIGVLRDAEVVWHSDNSYRETPLSYSGLYALEIPPSGGETGYVNMYHALETLPRELRARIEGRTLKHDLTYNSAGDLRATVGNLRLGTVSNFATTQPLAWAVFRSSTQPAGAITTAGGVGANDTTVQKIIAAGTINNVET